jgi:uncharacterized protein YkwD
MKINCFDTEPMDSEPAFSRDRRTFIAGSGLLALSALAGCGTTMPTGSGAGASSSAAGTLAGIRSAANLSRLAPDSQLERAALQQAGYMASAKRMTHTTGWGKDFASRVNGNHIEGAAAENVAEGRMDIRRLFDMWMNSPPHRRNILDARFTRFGLAYVSNAKNPDWRYWALVLGK